MLAEVIAASALALAVSFLATPQARRLAIATNFYDRPVRYKAHRRPTPYLGGLAVLAGFLAGAVAFGDGLGRFEAVLAGALVLAFIGTLDDRIGLGVGLRLGTQIGVAFVVWNAGLGWHIFGDDLANLAVTLFWVVGVINAFNLMDNLDGATGTVAAVSAAGGGVLALANDAPELAALAFALAAACIGFLPHNLASPSRIFLGDGGSTPIGFLVAAIVMSIPAPSFGWVTFLAAAPLAGLVILDTTLVVISRIRRRAKVLGGARDHITHRLLLRLRTPRRVAIALGAAQALLCGLAATLYQLDHDTVVAVSAVYLGIGMVVIALFETPFLAPQGDKTAGPPARRERSIRPSVAEADSVE